MKEFVVQLAFPSLALHSTAEQRFSNENCRSRVEILGKGMKCYTKLAAAVIKHCVDGCPSVKFNTPKCFKLTFLTFCSVEKCMEIKFIYAVCCSWQ